MDDPRSAWPRPRAPRAPGLSYDISVVDLQDPGFIDKGMKAALDDPAQHPALSAGPYRRRQHPFLLHVRRWAWTARRCSQYSPAITRAVNDLVRDMAGSISAEHGIGIDKIDELAHYRSKVELDTMRTLKRALDPKNIMNPGKILRLA